MGGPAPSLARYLSMSQPVEENQNKPNAPRAGWKTLATARPYETEVCTLREDETEVHGKVSRYAYLERAEAVIVVPITRAGEIVTLLQYRYPVDEWCLEVPAGGTHDVGDLSLEEVVRKELHEEAGATAGKLTYVNFFFTAAALTDEKCHVYLAEDVDLTAKPDREATETIQSKLMPAADALNLARNGEVKSAPCALALLLCEPLLRELGYLK